TERISVCCLNLPPSFGLHVSLAVEQRVKASILFIPHHVAEKAKAVLGARPVMCHFGIALRGLRVCPRMTCLGDNKLVLTTYRLEVVRKSAEESTTYRIDGLRIPVLPRSSAEQMFHRIGKGKPGLRGRHTGLLRLASGDVKDRDQQGNVGSGCHRILRESNTQI